VRDIGPGGGIVFYVATAPFTCGEDLKARCLYLEAAIADGTTPSTWTPDTKAEWGCYGTSVSGTSLEIGTGKANSDNILEKCKTADIAADVANKYFTSTAGAGQWFLPSRKELDALCDEFFTGRTGDDYSQDTCMGSGNSNAVTSTTNEIAWSFAADHYWSSSEYAAGTAWYQNFVIGAQGYSGKSNSYSVRPVRAF
jgi:hypothetical protein